MQCNAMQFAIYLAFLMFLQNWAHAAMDPGQQQPPDGDFAPNLVNTICFLVNFIIQARERKQQG